jgi:hypothetical protein
MKILCAVLLATVLSGCNSNSVPGGGNNGITFNMNQKDVEKLGFVFKESKPDDWFSVSCSHMTMTGHAFSHNTAEYKVTINRQDGKVCEIDATFTDIATLQDYMLISSNVTDFYPTKVRAYIDKGSYYRRDSHFSMWIDKNKAKLSLDHYGGVPTVVPEKISVSFLSPNYPQKD